MPFPTAPARRAALVFALIGLAGCAPEPEIRSYTVPAATPPSVPLDEAQPKVRLLGAIVPAPSAPGSSWFVKLVGPIDAVTAAEKDFDSFIGSLKLTGDEKAPFGWVVPAGWTADTGNQNRVVTLTGGPANAPLQMYISLPFGGSVADNVNRWRVNDAGLRKLPAADADKLVTKLMVGPLAAYRVDLKGPGTAKKGGPMMGG